MDLFDLCVRLKVCEGCGCLWYRYEIELNVYCHLCADRLKEFPTVKSRKQRGRPRKAILPTVFAVEDPAGLCPRSQEFIFAMPPHQPRQTGTASSLARTRLQEDGYGLHPAHIPAQTMAHLAGGAQ